MNTIHTPEQIQTTRKDLEKQVSELRTLAHCARLSASSFVSARIKSNAWGWANLQKDFAGHPQLETALALKSAADVLAGRLVAAEAELAQCKNTEWCVRNAKNLLDALETLLTSRTLKNSCRRMAHRAEKVAAEARASL